MCEHDLCSLKPDLNFHWATMIICPGSDENEVGSDGCKVESGYLTTELYYDNACRWSQHIKQAIDQSSQTNTSETNQIIESYHFIQFPQYLVGM